MTNQNRRRQKSSAPPAEPSVCRWPHQITGTPPAQELDAAIYFLRCSLSYQNQMLAEIKTLLEELTTSSSAPADPRKNSG